MLDAQFFLVECWEGNHQPKIWVGGSVCLRSNVDLYFGGRLEVSWFGRGRDFDPIPIRLVFEFVSDFVKEYEAEMRNFIWRSRTSKILRCHCRNLGRAFLRTLPWLETANA